MSDIHEPWHEDAKLSTEQRNKLKGSTFCGPGRSFPVPDCAHVTAARRLIGRANVGESTKSKILACVSRKAKALGCGDSSDDLKDAEVEKLIEGENYDDTRELLSFLEYLHKDSTPDEKKLDSLKLGLATLLDRLRSDRLGIDSSTSRADAYNARPINSIIDSLLDEMN